MPTQESSSVASLPVSGRPGLESCAEVVYDLLVGGLSHLTRGASRSGHWHDSRSTALAAMCLQIREENSLWLLTSRDWILDQQIQGGLAAGSWGEEIWDTAMCLLCLRELEVSARHPAFQAGLKWLGALYSANGRSNWHDEPWETSWALIAILRGGEVPAGVDVAASLKWLASLQSPEGRLVAPHYTAYFILIEHLYARRFGVDPALRAASDRCVDFLLSNVEPDRLWTGEAWANGQILWVLCQTQRMPVADPAFFKVVVDWFRAAQAVDGNWSDIEDTASAILGLHRLLVTLKICSDGHETEVHESIERRLRKGVPLPRLRLRKPFFERDDEADYYSIHLRASTARRIAAVLAFLLVGLVGWLANLLSLYHEATGK